MSKQDKQSTATTKVELKEEKKKEQAFTITPIATFHKSDKWEFSIEVSEQYRKGLKALDGFSHIMVIGYAHKNAATSLDSTLVLQKPYTKGPEKIGCFATRTTVRPNPLIVSMMQVTNIDVKKGILSIAYADFEDGTPVIDIKPYHPSSDRVKSATVPKFCEHWPKSCEESGQFDWSKEFTC
eukprot:TRINITY_DN36_c0_g1_i1.p1 TRINITY_DN36_c0_g1~~TRINITY_DN36_c0_g1_i1.p1  ORF type:complete len:182 (+),score=53.29 TRINITY_DN36_c0_g1_i1:1254-1799(+)